MLYFIPSMIGNALLWQLPRDNKSGLLGALYIGIFYLGSYVQILSLISSNVAGHTKKTVINATASSFAYVGAIVSPHVFKGEEEAEGYPTGVKSLLILLAVGEGLFALLWLYYKRENARRERRMAELPPDCTEESVAFLDLTDQEVCD